MVILGANLARWWDTAHFSLQYSCQNGRKTPGLFLYTDFKPFVFSILHRWKHSINTHCLLEPTDMEVWTAPGVTPTTHFKMSQRVWGVGSRPRTGHSQKLLWLVTQTLHFSIHLEVSIIKSSLILWDCFLILIKRPHLKKNCFASYKNTNLMLSSLTK